MDMLTKEFNNNPFGIKITAVSAGHYGQIFTKFVNLIGTEELPDMVVGYQNQLALFNMPGAESLIDMNDLVNQKWAMHPETIADIPDSFWPRIFHRISAAAVWDFPKTFHGNPVCQSRLVVELAFDNIQKTRKTLEPQPVSFETLSGSRTFRKIGRLKNEQMLRALVR